MKNTAKRVAALRTLLDVTKKNHSHQESPALYDTLESLSYWWDATEGKWKNTPQPSTSMFLNDEGASTGLLRVRVMGMPSDFDHFMTSVRADGWGMIEASDPYSNRKGPGFRWYLTYKRNT